jgi:molecular chaperone GrpE
MNPTPESQPHPDVLPPDAAAQPSPLELENARLREQLAAAEKKLDEVMRAASAAKNEWNDFRNRLQRERDQLIDIERGRAATAMLEAADELDRALKAAAQDTSPLAQGFRMVRESMRLKMQDMKLEPIPLLGLPFDPNLAEAVDLVEVDDPAQDGLVQDELGKAYRFNGKLLRVGRVRVGKRKGPASA